MVTGNPFMSFYQSQDYQRGLEEGLKISEAELKRLMKRIYKFAKKELIKDRMYCTGTMTTYEHKCNCEFCDLDKKEKD